MSIDKLENLPESPFIEKLFKDADEREKNMKTPGKFYCKGMKIPCKQQCWECAKIEYRIII